MDQSMENEGNHNTRTDGSGVQGDVLAYLVVDNRTDEILYFNQQFCDIWGIGHLAERMHRKELKNNDIIRYCLPMLVDPAAFAESCKPLLSYDNRVVVEDEIPFIEGRAIRRFSTQIRDENDEYHKRLYIFEEITERKKAEKFVQIQRDLGTGLNATSDLNEAMNLALDALLSIAGIDGAGIYYKDVLTREMKLMAHRGFSARFMDIVKRYKPSSAHRQSIISGKPVHGTFEEIIPDDGFADARDEMVSLAVMPILHEGNVVGSINAGSRTSKDFFKNNRSQIEAIAHQIGGAITRITAMTALRMQNFAFESFALAIIIIDVNGVIQWINPAFSALSGYSWEEVVGKNNPELIRSDVHNQALYKEMWLTILGGKVWSGEIINRRKDGSAYPEEMTVTPVFDPNGDIISFIAIKQDITLRKYQPEKS
jgi:PAS domain S-box-containing protein